MTDPGARTDREQGTPTASVPEDAQTSTQPMRRLDLLACGGVTLLAAALLLLLRPAASLVAGLYPAALPPHPYFVPEHAVLLYAALPLAVLSAVVLLLAPGVFAVLAAGGYDSKDPRIRYINIADSVGYCVGRCGECGQGGKPAITHSGGSRANYGCDVIVLGRKNTGQAGYYQYGQEQFLHEDLLVKIRVERGNTVGYML